nr:clathrin, heavy chain/VPS, 7-fold repeat-containing protein [Tanacetum cinerariifolium]
MMQALAERCSTKGWLQPVEQCVFYMDISSLDFNQLNDAIVDVLKLVDGYSGIDAYDVWKGHGLMVYVHDVNMND